MLSFAFTSQPSILGYSFFGAIHVNIIKVLFSWSCLVAVTPGVTETAEAIVETSVHSFFFQGSFNGTPYCCDQTPNTKSMRFSGKKWPFGPCFEVSFPGRVKVGKGGKRVLTWQLNSSIFLKRHKAIHITHTSHHCNFNKPTKTNKTQKHHHTS